MTSYYINGNKVCEGTAAKFFFSRSPARYEMNQSEFVSLWDDCQTSESVRDSYLPDGLEIVQA